MVVEAVEVVEAEVVEAVALDVNRFASLNQLCFHIQRGTGIQWIVGGFAVKNV